jgi:hypothetical protein
VDGAPHVRKRNGSIPIERYGVCSPVPAAKSG